MLTIVIPTVGRSHTFGRAFYSALKIDRHFVTKIIVIDNSQSATFRSYLAEITSAVNDNRVNIVNHPERVSMASSWNSSLEAIDTDWVLFLHDDDELLCINPHLDSMRSIINKSPDVGFFAFKFKCQYYSTVFKRIKRVERQWFNPIQAINLIEECPKFVSTIFNVRNLKKIKGFSDSYGNFLDLVAFLELLNSFGAIFVPITLGVYHLHDDNESDIAKRSLGYGNYIPSTCKRIFELHQDRTVRSLFLKTSHDFVYPNEKKFFAKILGRIFKFN